MAPQVGVMDEEEDAAIPVSVARKVTRMPINETKPLVVGDWLSDKDIIAWRNPKLYHNEIGEPQAWTTAVTYIVSRLNIMKKCGGSRGIGHTTVGLVCRRRHIFIVNGDDREGLYWFVCAMDCRVLVWAFKV